MGFRFSRSFKIARGIKVNVGKSGLSATVGTKGAKFTMGPRGTRTTLGVPGTGVSWSTSSKPSRRDRSPKPESGTPPPSAKNNGASGCGCLAIVVLGLLAIAQCSGDDGEDSGANVATASAPSQTRYVTASSVANCRSGAAASSNVVAKVDRGSMIEVVGEETGWSQVRSAGQTCWISTSLLGDQMPAEPKPLLTAEPPETGWGSSSDRSSFVEDAPRISPRRAVANDSVYYRNCSAARAAGAAPVYAGEPGYASHLDRDGDGVGCE